MWGELAAALVGWKSEREAVCPLGVCRPLQPTRAPGCGLVSLGPILPIACTYPLAEAAQITWSRTDSEPKTS